MAMACSLRLAYGRPFRQTDSSCSEVNCGFHKFRVANDHFVTPTIGQRHGTRFLKFSKRLKMSTFALRGSFAVITCGSPISTGDPKQLISLKSATSILNRVCNTLETGPPLVKCTPSALIAVFAIWGLEPVLQFIRHTIFRHSASNWKKSRTYYIMASYIRPIMLWSSALLLCRVFDPVTLSTEASQVIKQRVITFVRSLSTVLAIAYCASSLVKQVYKLAMEQSDAQDTRNMGYNFVSNAIYTAVWVAAVSLFMELLGFSTQKWLTAGGLGTLLLTLAGREIFTNFLSSVMIHAAAPFRLNEWIQTRIDGGDISGHVERIGWWSPSIIRGDDREAIYIPNHKFTMSVVRNLTQKTHWRIKSYICISHQDVHKISNIIADMRKVIAKNPQVEQQRLHRRIFFDNVDPENQSLRILVSCFVKTSHFEEYLCVKEAIFLDLLRVISHHRARLATPIRTIQKVYGDRDTQNIPFEENITGRAVSRHLYLIESSRMPGEDRARQRARDKDDSKVVTLEAKTVESQVPSQLDDTKQQNSGVKESKDNSKQQKEKARDTVVADMATKSGLSSPSSTKGAADGTDSSNQKKQLEGMDSMGLNSNDITLLKAAYEKPPIDIPEASVEVTASNRENNGKKSNGDSMKRSEKPVSINKENKSSSDALKKEGRHYVESDKSGTERSKGFKSESVSQLEVDKGKAKVQEQFSGASSKSDSSLSSSASITSRSSLDENIVLGVAIDGPKRTLPIEEGVPQEQKEFAPSSKNSNEQKEFAAASKNSNANSGGNDRKDSQMQPSEPVKPDERKNERQ